MSKVGKYRSSCLEMKMEVIIKELDATNIQQVNQCDNAFLADAVLHLSIEDDKIRYTVIPVPSYEKRYPSEEVDTTAYLGRPDRTIFFAYIDGQPAGQIILRKYWNNYAYIDDIVVDVKFRRCGVGKALLSQAVQWTKSKNLPGIMLETQNNNVGACKFYERFGFQLGGFDRMLYKGINPGTDEIALYWYYLC